MDAGRCEAAFAGALGVTLGGRNDYAGRVEERPLMGTGRPVDVEDVERAVRLSALVSRTAGVLVVVAMMLRIWWLESMITCPTATVAPSPDWRTSTHGVEPVGCAAPAW